MKKMHNLYAFVTLSATTFLVLHCGVKQRTFGFEKVTSRQQKIYTIKRAIMLHSYMLHCLTNFSTKEQ